MVPTPTDLRFLRVYNSKTQSILYYLNHFQGKTSLKTWMRIRKRFRKSRKLSTEQKSKELYNIKCSGQGAQILKIHGRC